jgi:hypothetical protein
MQNSSKNSKSILARALATENLRVEHSPSAKTAMFDVVNRVLILPVWKDMSDEMYDMFVGHEVGHALYTPKREKDLNNKKPWIVEAEEIGGTLHAPYVQGLLNVVEDVRIEKKIKDKFPGLRRDFTHGYRELMDRNFFGTKDKKFSEFSFADRINIHFKGGAMVNVPFSDEEMEFVNMIETVETFEDTISFTKKLYDYISGKKQDENGGENSENEFVESNSNDGDPSNVTMTEEEKSEENMEESFQSSASGGGNGLAPNVLPPIITQSNFDANQSKLVDKDVYSSVYCTLPNPDVKNMILPWKKTQETLSLHYAYFEKKYIAGSSTMIQIRNSFDELMVTSKPLIGTLVKQFEMKKAADVQKRTSVSRSGKIDADRIFKYKVSDDIFLRCAKIADGKNHGMVMFVDWSASMQISTNDVLTQIVMLTQFCRRMSIPFDVYLFSSQYPVLGSSQKQYIEEGSTKYYNRHDKSSEKMYQNNLALIHVLSSEMKTQEFNEGLFNVFTLGQMITGGNAKEGDRKNFVRSVPDYFNQGNTPLDTTILAAMKIVPEFQQKTKVQIVNTIFLTDGDAGDSMFAGNYSGSKVSVTCPFNKKEYNYGSKQEVNLYSTDLMLKIFADVTGSNTIGFYVCNGRYCRYLSTEEMKKVRSEGFAEVMPKNKEGRMSHGYDRLFVLPNNQEIVEVEEELDSLAQGATITKIRNTFAKAVEKRGASRSFMNRFADVIAVAQKR